MGGEALDMNGADENAQNINMKPLMSGVKTEDEGLFVVQHKYWMETMQEALDKEKAAESIPKNEEILA